MTVHAEFRLHKLDTRKTCVLNLKGQSEGFTFCQVGLLDRKTSTNPVAVNPCLSVNYWVIYCLFVVSSKVPIDVGLFGVSVASMTSCKLTRK